MPSSGSLSPSHGVESAMRDGLSGSKPAGQSTVLFASFNLIKTFVGAGIFSAPHALLKTGFFGMIIILFVVSFIIYWTCRILIGIGARYNTWTYKDSVKQVLGRGGEYSEALATFLLTFGAMVSYCIIVADSLPPFFLQVTGWSSDCLTLNPGSENYPGDCPTSGHSTAKILLDRRVLLGITGLCILLPLILLPNIHMLSYSSLFGMFCFAFILISLAQRAFSLPQSEKGTLKGLELYSFLRWDGLTSGISRAAFMNISQHAQFTILNSLKVPSERNGKTIVASALITSVVSILLLSILTYIPINEKMTSNVIQAFPEKDVLVNLCRLALSFHIMCSYPLQGHVCRDGLIGILHGISKIGTSRMLIIAYGFGMFITSWGIALFVCNLGFVVDLTGGVAASYLAFALPALCWMVLAKSDGVKNYWRYIPALLVFLLGVFITILTIKDVIVEATSSKEGAEACRYKFI